jgi:hypothetical protein
MHQIDLELYSMASLGIIDIEPLSTEAGIAQSVWRLSMGWTTEGSEYESR